MKNFIKKGLEKIKKEKIEPTASWKFSLQNFFWWLAFSFSILAGGVSISILTFLIAELDWQIYANLGNSSLETFLIMFPHFWIIFLGLFMVISYQNLRHTRKGYHYEVVLVTAVIIGGSLFLGAVLYFSGLNQKLNQIFLESIPGYENVIHTKEDQWSQPKKGLLSGEIVSKKTVEESQVLILKNIKSGTWKIFINDNTQVRGRVRLEEGEKIKVIGRQKKEKSDFEAMEIRPWEGMGHNRKNDNK
ncbi:hypothetical protein HN784_01660 [bacterium]|jgi:hypothetical protein|nr:hypothetical protein [bacterium]MBT4250969.1 hypothetical protein [bacterium]MBT4597843.1 hypothetical protein [bacterium]MBT6753965.1 hypothetical protein [bacterium]MBT7037394.1 hypothetical protein [bacterium]